MLYFHYSKTKSYRIFSLSENNKFSYISLYIHFHYISENNKLSFIFIVFENNMLSYMVFIWKIELSYIVVIQNYSKKLSITYIFVIRKKWSFIHFYLSCWFIVIQNLEYIYKNLAHKFVWWHKVSSSEHKRKCQIIVCVRSL